jgi:NADPH:quinone reductase-like Zn-dependent oxidoreductase
MKAENSKLKMKAAVRRTYGSPKEIRVEKIERPRPNDDEILVKIHATTVNRTDCANLTAQPFIMRFLLGLFKPKKIVLGTDFAGEVIATGKNLISPIAGERVFGFTDKGLESQAEYLVIAPKGNVLIVPENIDYKQAAASLEGAHYAYSFLHKVKTEPGQRILINGASGGIGSALLQFSKQFELHISATCSTKNIDLIKSLGAHKVFDYSEEDFTRSTEKYDFVFDAVGKSTFRKCKPILQKGGVYISSELGAYSQNIFFAIGTSFGGNKKVIFPIPFSLKKTLPFIHDALKQEKFKPVIDREYSLADISEAYEFVISGEKTGNVIVNV